MCLWVCGVYTSYYAAELHNFQGNYAAAAKYLSCRTSCDTGSLLGLTAPLTLTGNGFITDLHRIINGQSSQELNQIDSLT